ncbi:hypothetical protein DFH07DRAFT_794365 [Mycena maculata]|uniref:F-box domain-containing protein n=1 Tax=Mycena maculata TaxID=230809 RepID=A0AAD7KCK5_9AGAR|nr:hypothetical protein DFH07DRAFT_794365 [Mycena maculata]
MTDVSKSTPPKHSPKIFSLPNELLVTIVAAGQEDRVRGGFRPEWTLSHVSRRFRDTIIDASTLWTHVEAESKSEGSVEIFKLHLERSKLCRIWVTLVHDTSIEDCSIIDHVTHLVPHIHRIWRLQIKLGDMWKWARTDLLEPFRHVAAPCLEHLEIDDCGELPMDFFSCGAPKLTVLKLAFCTPLLPVPQWTISLAHLEWCMCSESGDNHLFAAMMAQCHSLVHLSLDLRPGIELGPMNIPSLKFLVLSTTMQALPALRKYISTLFNRTNLTLPSFPALTSLSFIIDGCHCEMSSPFPCETIPSPPLQLFPALSSLTLINQCFTQNILSDLLGPDSPPWPLLRTITLSPKDTDSDGVYSVLQRVARSKQTLPKFRLSAVLYSKEHWDENGVDAELFDPTDLIAALVH